MAQNLPAHGVTTGKGGGVTIRLEPPVEFIARQTGAFRATLEDLSPLWLLFEHTMEDIERRWFDTEGDGTWPQLAETTREQKQREGWPDQILVRTGSLRDSLIDPNNASTKTPRSMEWGSDIDYAGYHQGGTDRMPAREVIPDPFPTDDRRKLEADMVTYINAAANLTFGRVRAA